MQAFLLEIRRLAAAYRRFEWWIWALNAGIIASVLYCIALITGITAMVRFFWQDNLFLANIASILCIILGLIAAGVLKKRGRRSLFSLLGPDSEPAQTAYDCRHYDSVIMQSLAEEVFLKLSAIKGNSLWDKRLLYGRLGLLAIMLTSVLALSHSQIGNELSESDFQAIADLQDMIMGGPQEPFSQEENAADKGQIQIYGKPSLAVLQESKMELMLYPGTGMGSRPVETTPLDQSFLETPPGHGVPVPSEVYIESLPAQHREIIKTYFTFLSKMDTA